VSSQVADVGRRRVTLSLARVGSHERRFNRYHAWWTRLLLLSLMFGIAASAIFPIYFMLSAALRTQKDWGESEVGLPTTWSLASFRRAWVGADIGQYMLHSVIITACTVTLAVVVACLGGFAFSKLRWSAKRPVYLFVIAWIAVPPIALIVPIYIEMVRLHVIDTFASVILLYTALNTPFNTYLMTAFFRSLPDDLIEASRMDGASVVGIFRRVMLPLAKPAIATLCVFNVLSVWNEFIYASLLLPSTDVKPLTVGVLQLQGTYFTDNPALMAGLLLSSLPVIAAYVFFQKFLIRAVVAGAVR
jgi:ABC-type glycerol-3-phosphate transport system permease component